MKWEKKSLFRCFSLLVLLHYSSRASLDIRTGVCADLKACLCPRWWTSAISGREKWIIWRAICLSNVSLPVWETPIITERSHFWVEWGLTPPTCVQVFSTLVSKVICSFSLDVELTGTDWTITPQFSFFLRLFFFWQPKNSVRKCSVLFSSFDLGGS